MDASTATKRRSTRAHQAINSATLEQLSQSPVLKLDDRGDRIDRGSRQGHSLPVVALSKGALVAEAITSTLQVEDPPDTDDFRADLIAAVEISIISYTHPPSGVLITALAADLADDPALLTSFLEDFVFPRRRLVASRLERGIREGFIDADCNVDVVMDIWAGVLIYRGLMKYLAITDDLAARLVDAAIVDEPGTVSAEPSRCSSDGSPHDERDAGRAVDPFFGDQARFKPDCD